MSRKSLSRYLGLILLSAIGSGCIPVNYYETGSRRNVQEETALTILPGQTNREDVLFALGAPDEVSPDGSCIVYNWAKVKALFGSEVGSGKIVQKSSLIITFDERGVVVQREVQKNLPLPW